MGDATAVPSPGDARTNGIAAEGNDFPAARDELLRLTRRRYYAAMATATPDGQPEAAPLRYAVTDAFELVMGTLTTSRKYANLRRNAKVAVVIWDDEWSIQIEGVFDELSGADGDRLHGFFASEFPREHRLREGRPAHVFFSITPVWARYSDFTDEPARVLTVDFARETAVREQWPVVASPGPGG